LPAKKKKESNSREIYRFEQLCQGADEVSSPFDGSISQSNQLRERFVC